LSSLPASSSSSNDFEIGSSKQIPVNAAVPNTLPHMPRVFISTSMFTADLDPTVHCHPDLLEKQEWDFEIEVAPDKRLSPLR
jgi:hypothetical protein